MCFLLTSTCYQLDNMALNASSSAYLGQVSNSSGPLEMLAVLRGFCDV